MSNLRILKKRDGSQVVQTLMIDDKWQDLPIVEEASKKSLAQVLFETFQIHFTPGYKWENASYDVKQASKAQANAAREYLEKEGWRRPSDS